MTSTPSVTVLMSVFNGDAYLREAIDSILNQSLRDFEFVIIDDASTDETPRILDEYARADQRIRLLRNDSNIGLACSLNRGIDMAKGCCIARMDADDIALPERLLLQKEYLDAYPGIGIVGSALILIDRRGAESGTSHWPEHDTEIRWHNLFHSAFPHPAVMLRAALLRDNHLRYHPDLEQSQDFDLWSRLLEHSQGANLPFPLLRYRMHEGQTGRARRDAQQSRADEIALRNLSRIGVHLSREQVSTLRSWPDLVPPGFSGEEMRLMHRVRDAFVAFARLGNVDHQLILALRRDWIRRAMLSAWKIRRIRALFAATRIALPCDLFRIIGGSLAKRIRGLDKTK